MSFAGDGQVAPQPVSPTDFLYAVRRRHGALWRLVVVLVAIVAGLVVLPLAVLLLAEGVARLIGTSYSFLLTDGVSPLDMLVINLGLAALIGWAMLLARVLYGVRPRWLSSMRPGLRWAWLSRCVAMTTVVWSLLLVGGTWGAIALRKTPIGASVWLFVIVVLLTTPLQAAGEEYLFRGVLLKATGALGWPVVVCCLANGVLFALAHLQFAPELLADRVLLGVVLAFLAVRTQGLEAGIAIHTVYNLAALIPAGFLDRVNQTLNPRGVNWVPVVVHAVLLAIVVPWLLAAASRRVRSLPPLGHGPYAAPTA